MPEHRDPPDAEPAPLDHGRPRRSWWRRPRWHLGVGLASLAFGYGLTLSWFPGPAIFMGFGGLLIGLAVPMPDGGE